MTTTLDSFETALLTELRTVIAQRTPTPAPHRPRRSWNRRWVLAPVGIAAAAVTAIVVVPGIGPEPAYAVTVDGSGDVHVRVDRLEDAAGLERALEAHGIAADVTYLPAGQICADGRFDEAASAPAGTMMTFGMGSNGYWVDLDAGAIRDGETLVIATTRIAATSETNQGGVGGSVGIASGAVGPCVPEPMPLLPAGSGEVSRSRGDEGTTTREG